MYLTTFDGLKKNSNKIEKKRCLKINVALKYPKVVKNKCNKKI